MASEADSGEHDDLDNGSWLAHERASGRVHPHDRCAICKCALGGEGDGHPRVPTCLSCEPKP